MSDTKFGWTTNMGSSSSCCSTSSDCEGFDCCDKAINTLSY